MTDITTTAEDTNQDEELDIEEEFRSLYGDAEKIKERWAKIAASKGGEHAEILRLVSGDLLQLVQDTIAATAAGIVEALAAAPDAEGGEDTLDEEEVEQIYMTIYSNTQAFKQLLIAVGDSDAGSKEKIEKLVAMNEETLAMLRENYGEELEQDAINTIQKAVEAAEEE